MGLSLFCKETELCVHTPHTCWDLYFEFKDKSECNLEANRAQNVIILI